METLKKVVFGIILLPFLLILIFILYECFGMYINHSTTDKQTRLLQANLEQKIPDIEIINVYSETGNTGNGNHVDCLSSIDFSTELSETEIENRMSTHYEIDGWGCDIVKTNDGYYTIRFITSAPFVDNIEGH